MIKKKIFYTILFAMLLSTISFALCNVSNADEVEQEGFSLVCKTEEVNKGEDISIDVVLNTNGTNGFLGHIVYDEDLELIQVQKAKDLNEKGLVDFEPKIPERSEVIVDEENGKKGFSFDMIVSDDFQEEMIGSNTILTLTFSTSNCEKGKTYNFEWDESEVQVLGSRTYMIFENTRKSITNEGTSCKIKGNEIDEETQALAEESALNEENKVIPLTDEEKETLASAYRKGNAYDKDDVLDVEDAMVILEYFTETKVAHNQEPLTKMQLYIYDVNEDNDIDSQDAQYLVTYVSAAGLDLLDSNKSIKENVDAMFEQRLKND